MVGHIRTLLRHDKAMNTARRTPRQFERWYPWLNLQTQFWGKFQRFRIFPKVLVNIVIKQVSSSYECGLGISSQLWQWRWRIWETKKQHAKWTLQSLYLPVFFLILQVHVVNRGGEASSDRSAASLPFPNPSPPFPASNRGQRVPCLLVVPNATGKLRRGELGRGRNGVLNYKVTRENQSLLELSWYWRHSAHQTLDQWVSPGRRRKEEGSRAGY